MKLSTIEEARAFAEEVASELRRTMDPANPRWLIEVGTDVEDEPFACLEIRDAATDTNERLVLRVCNVGEVCERTSVEVARELAELATKSMRS